MFMLTVNCWNYEPFTLSLWFWIPKWLNKLRFVKLSTLFCIQARSSIFNESSYYNCFMIYYTLFCGMYRNHFVRLSIRLYLSYQVMEKHRNFLLHTKIACDLRLCYDFDLRSFEQIQGHWKEKCKIVSSPCLYFTNIGGSNITQRLLMT